MIISEGVLVLRLEVQKTPDACGARFYEEPPYSSSPMYVRIIYGCN